MRALACATAILGGACWVVQYFVDQDILYWIGLGLLGITALLAGLASVPHAPIWLQLIVGAGSVGLFAAVLTTLHSAADETTVNLALGAVAIVVFAIVAFRLPRAEKPPRHVGTHAR
ncbi:hypothetical protein EKO23_13350 [Nocardioides guangzhouensis]|uniref:Uncharacterized protein n=1 Tax=Nocardioides guangzhouensis TaxID=2497878 RepID=A0A4Q4ZCC0_9ACTN|nr:hypothetical protein [Nocardioides guangzhouensis]RYP85235.1 hypothetical protein EKO23_13350 [Nocardioides guangzhouensis]